MVACDELTGFIVACCLVRPAGVTTLTPKSVKKKLKDKHFAAKVDRAEVACGIELLQVDRDEHITFIIEALKPFWHPVLESDELPANKPVQAKLLVHRKNKPPIR